MHDIPIHGNRQNLHKWRIIKKTGSLRMIGVIAIGVMRMVERIARIGVAMERRDGTWEQGGFESLCDCVQQWKWCFMTAGERLPRGMIVGK